MSTKTTETQRVNQQQEPQNVIKLGHFQLQTKNFWLSLVAILTLFIISMTWIVTFFNYKTIKILNEQNLKLISILESKKQ